MRPKLIVDKTALAENYKKLCSICRVEVIPVLKSNAYGLGTLAAMRFYEELGVKRVAVSRVSEGELIANSGTKCEIILLSSTSLKEDINRGLSAGLTLTAGTPETLKVINECAVDMGKKAKVHLLIDTGFNHSGIKENEYREVADTLPRLRGITVSGIFTQFSESHSTNGTYTELQNERFEQAVVFFRKSLGGELLVHAANSCAAVKYPETRYDAVRIGSGLLGRFPAGVSAGLKRIGYLECGIRELKRLPKGEYVGYSRQYKTKRETVIAIVPAGLSDGLASGRASYGRKRIAKIKEALKSLFNIFGDDNIYATLNGKRVQVLGKISQHCTVLDVTGIECTVGDKVRFEVSPLFIPATVEKEYV